MVVRPRLSSLRERSSSVSDVIEATAGVSARRPCARSELPLQLRLVKVECPSRASARAVTPAMVKVPLPAARPQLSVERPHTELLATELLRKHLRMNLLPMDLSWRQKALLLTLVGPR